MVKAKTSARWCCAVVLAFVAGAGVVASHARGQLSVERTYFGVGRELPISVALPGPLPAGAVAHVRLLEPVTGRIVAESPVPVEGGGVAASVDLAKLLPVIWMKPRLVYAQLVVVEAAAAPRTGPGGVPGVEPEAPPMPVERKVGPALVLQPLTNPARAELDERNPRVPQVIYPRDRQPEKPVMSGYRVYKDRHAVIETDLGSIRVALRPDAAPNTAWNFRDLVERGFYTDIEFHRVVAAGREGKGFVIQTGDPTGTGEGGPGYDLPLEPSTLPHDFGVLSMARDKQPDTAGSQFFIALSRVETARLDGLYAAFGQTVDGAAVIRAIAATPVAPGPEHRPVRAPRIKRAYLVNAPPYPEGLRPVTEAAGGR